MANLSKTFSQDITKAYSLLNQNKFNEAKILFQKSLDKQKKVIESKYGLAMLFFNPNYEDFNTDKSYRYICNLNKLLLREKEGSIEQLKNKYGITGQNIEQLKNEIISTAYREAEKSQSIESLNNFINIYKAEQEIEYATELRNHIAFEKAREENTYQAYDYFVRNYPKSQQIDSAKELYLLSCENFYKQYTIDGEYSTIVEFKRKYPRFDYPDSLIKQDFKIARLAQELEFHKSINHKQGTNNDSILSTINKYGNYIKKAAPRELAFIAMQRLIEDDLLPGNWQNALDTIKKYGNYFNNNQRVKELTAIITTEQQIEVKGISPNVNTEANEYAPVITADDNYLYFCARKHPQNIGGEDIFISGKENGEWSKPNLVNGINNKYGNEAPLSVTADGNIMLLYSNSNIYFSKKTKDGWTEIQSLDLINTTDWEADAMFSSDGNALIFVSDRKGGRCSYHPLGELYHANYNGNTDIYVAIRTDKGWEHPINLGSIINTPFAERSPFLHPDMKTLYFSSDGYGGLGRLDIYKSTRLSDTSWTQWSKPVNLGRAINSPKDDWGYRVTTDGTKAYFAGKKEKDYDIFELLLPANLKPGIVVTISGKVTNHKTGKPLKSVLKWEDLSTGKIIGIAESDPGSGNYFIVLPIGKQYGYFAEKTGYYPISNNINLKDVNSSANITENMEMVPISEIRQGNIVIPINNLFFDSNKYKIKAESYSELDRLVKTIKELNVREIEISGHTDNKGEAAYNIKLSENRANSVKEYLQKKGCTHIKLSTKGYGAKIPISSNDTGSGRAKNRRVEFRIIQ